MPGEPRDPGCQSRPSLPSLPLRISMCGGSVISSSSLCLFEGVFPGNSPTIIVNYNRTNLHHECRTCSNLLVLNTYVPEESKTVACGRQAKVTNTRSIEQALMFPTIVFATVLLFLVCLVCFSSIPIYLYYITHHWCLNAFMDVGRVDSSKY